ncbi:MAG: alpha/beta fold hydrolase [Candidatus Lokiarchaeota archaeon]|nr:alpha/beta fold hydrolase [Candidatus Lokiarchaeota archaeon]MBD3201611.1 alpha/beta fold hydrolase [Candidatus Lokiarchaeota archaeon]
MKKLIIKEFTRSSMSEKFANINGIKISYEVKGKGEPLILVHGFGADKEVWIAQFEPLSEYFKVIRFDNRGAGKSDRPDEPYNMKMFADDINGLMEHLGIEKAHVLGWSLGGMIVQTFALKYPEKLKKLILINTLPKWPGDEKGLEMYKQSQIDKYHRKMEDPKAAYFEGAKMGFDRKFRKEMEKNPEKVFYGLFSAEDLIEISATNPSTPQDIKNQAHALGTYDVYDDLPNISTDTLILTAEKDRQTPRTMNEKIHEQIPNSKLIVIENAGHESPREKAPEVNQHIIDFLKD